jgi:hypothetical protein
MSENDSNNGNGNEDAHGGDVKLRISDIVGPSADPLVVEPGETRMDDTSRVALGSPRFRTEERTVSIIQGDDEIVPYYKQVMSGATCQQDHSNNEDGGELGSSTDTNSVIIQPAYCSECFNTLIPPGYQWYKRIRLLDVYIEWGGVNEPGFPSGQFVAHVDFEYHVTPGDFFELGTTVDDVAFNAGVGYAERHDNEGAPCLWRVLNVTTVTDDKDGYPVVWKLEGRNVESYEPVAAWFSKHAGEV